MHSGNANFSYSDIICNSKQMQEVINRAQILSPTNNTILIQGETGVGKEVLAHFIHKHSSRKDGSFLPVDCAAIPSELFESELFGFEKGAFSGAVDNYSGRFIQANNGTLFLDEIGEIPLHIQAKLLRVLDERIIYRLKSIKPIKIDVRLIIATNRDLAQEVKIKRFRNDLYYRLKEATITIPPLKERPEDILPLVHHFLRIYNQVYHKEVSKISKQAENYLLSYAWEGNVRELKNTIKSIIPFKSNNTIDVNDIGFSIIGEKMCDWKNLHTLEEHENEYIRKVLKMTGFNISRACEILAISRPRFYRRLKDLNLEHLQEL